MTRDIYFIEALRKIFTVARVNACYDSDARGQFDIVEENNSCSEIVKNNQLTISSFHIFNPKQETVHFFTVDGCLLCDSDSYKGKRNDCIIFNETDFCFVELKLNVASKKNRSQRTKDAIEQLGCTIEYLKNCFSQSSEDFMSFGFQYEAFVVFKTPMYPRNQAGAINRSVKFAQRYGVKLYEKNKKEFK